MVLCTSPDRCAVGSRENSPVFKTNSETFAPGDIGNIFASVRQVYQYQIDEAQLSRAASRYTAQKSRDACTEMESRADGGKLRPCLVLGLPDTSDDEDPDIHMDEPRLPPVALLATFGKADISKFPRGVRHHLVPIYTKGTNLGKYEHLHTTPDWDGRSPQYVVAYEYTPSEHKVLEHFRSPRTAAMPNGTHYSVEPRALTDLKFLCASKTRAWQRQPLAEKKRDAKALMKWMPPKEIKNWDARTFATAAPDLSRDMSGVVSPARSVKQVTFDADCSQRNMNLSSSSSPLASSFSATLAKPSNTANAKHNRLNSVTETEWTTVARKGRILHSPTTASPDAATLSSRRSSANAKSASSAINRRTHRQTMSLPDGAPVSGNRISPIHPSFKPWKRPIGGNNIYSIDSMENWRPTPKSRSDNLMDISEQMTYLLVQPQSELPGPESKVQLDDIHLETPIQQLSTEPPAIDASLEAEDIDSRRLSAASTMVALSEASGIVGSVPMSSSEFKPDDGYICDSPEKDQRRMTALPPPSPQSAVLVEFPQPITAPQTANNAAASANLSDHTPIVRQNTDTPSSDPKKSGMLTRVANTFSRKAKQQAAKARTEALAQ